MVPPQVARAGVQEPLGPPPGASMSRPRQGCSGPRRQEQPPPVLPNEARLNARSAAGNPYASATTVSSRNGAVGRARRPAGPSFATQSPLYSDGPVRPMIFLQVDCRGGGDDS